MHDPLGAFFRIRAFYLSYLDTASRLEGPDIREERRRLLIETGTLCTSPLLEPLPSWTKDGRTFEDLVEERGKNAILADLSPKARRAFVDLIGCGLIDRDEHEHLYRPYRHQIEMLKRGVRDGQAGIVTSGTGSGKTEAFLLPILASVIEEATRDKGGWAKPESGYPSYLNTKNRWWRNEDGQPKARQNRQKGNYELPDPERKAIKGKGLKWDNYIGHEQRCGEKRPAAIRALILYPMNALVEDQMTRLRIALDSQDARNTLNLHLRGNRIFFGRYTGQTKGGPAYLLEHERELSRSQGTKIKKLSDIIKGCDDNRTLTEYRKSVAASRERRIEDVIVELSKLDDLESAVREEAQLRSDQQVGLCQSKEIQDKAFAFPALDGAEMVTRWDMQEYPPDILVTNISMLNAMLSRKTEACMLEKTRKWLESDLRNRFTLVIDELHLQRGSAGTEFMYLLRLLFVRLGLDRPRHHHQLRLLASSASLPMDEINQEKSLNYLYDAFADFGLRGGAKKEDWFDAVIPGKPKNSTSKANLSVNETDLNEAIEKLMKIWAPKDDDSIFSGPDFKSYHDNLVEFFDKLNVPTLDSLEERWEWLASAIGCAFEKYCRCRGDDHSVAATSLEKIAKGCWPKHGWSPLEVERNMRLLTFVVSAADHSKELRKIRNKECWPVPRFRLHAFFRVPQGLFVDVVPPAWRSQDKSRRWQGELSIERTGTTTQTRPAPNSDREHYSVRQFELLSCECCGECFVGGIRANKENDLIDDDSAIIAELLPNEEDIESLPDSSISNRFEEYNYDDYIIFWPRDENNEDFDDNGNQEQWKQAWLNPINGFILDKFDEASEKRLQPGYLFIRTSKSKPTRITNQSPGSHTPCRCPRCKIDYRPKRNSLLQSSLVQFSPLRSQRPGLERTTQLLASELYGVLAGEGESSKARLVSFSDSRQAAARTALGVEKFHHRDVLREILLRAILSQSKQITDNDLLDKIRDLEIRKNKIENIKNDFPLKYINSLREQLEGEKTQVLYQSLGIIPLKSILELEPPKNFDEAPVKCKPFLAQCIRLRIHPFCERGITKLWLKGGRSFDWWELFSESDDSCFQWSFKDSKKLDDHRDYEKLCEAFLDKVLGVIGNIVFNKNYFALEATGLAYPVPQPPNSLLLKEEINKKELESDLKKAAAWMRIYTDNYRFSPFPPEWKYDGRTEEISLEQIEGKKLNIAKLIQSSAKSLEKSPKNLFKDMKRLMKLYGHSADNRDYIRLEKTAFRISEDSDPYWCCSNCGRIHLHQGLGSCTRCGERLPADATGKCANLQRDNFVGRRLRRSLSQIDAQENLVLGKGVFRLRCEELTGQTIDPASRQREFKGIPAERKHLLEPEGIEMLSVTTTMEVGIDIGPLEAILQANMPPQRFNYQQRVGRAGRRGQAFSFVLTLCRSRSHDLHYFSHPENITGDPPPPPFLVKRLPRIAERLLCKDQLIAAFQWLERKHRAESKGFWLGDLVKPVDVHGDFIPVAALKGEKQKEWLEWLREALENSDVQEENKRTRDTMQRGNEYTSSLSSKSSDDLCKEIINSTKAIDKKTIGLAAHLANHGLLPMYGLPTRLRELVLGSGSYNNPTDSLSRDLEIAIYEYAPGNVLIHDKREHLCTGLTPRIDFSFAANSSESKSESRLATLSNVPWDRQLKLGQCPKCWAWKEIDEKLEEIDEECNSCKSKSPLRDWNPRWCLEPTAFRTDFNSQTNSTTRLPGSSSNSLCADSDPPPLDSWREVQEKTCRIRLTISDSTMVYRLNQGPKKSGFELRWKSGVLQNHTATGNKHFSPNDTSKFPLKSQAIDKRLLNNKDLKNILTNDILPDETISSIFKEPVYLAAPRITDGLYILPQKTNDKLAISFLGNDEDIPYFQQKNIDVSGRKYWQGVRAAAISAAEILISAATRSLDIEHRALQAVEPRLFRRQENERLPMIQIVDEHVNGAGFSNWLGNGDSPPILDVLNSIFNDQLEEWTQLDHKTKCQESCYRCLKTYDNQSIHALLDWRLGFAYLKAFTNPDWLCGLDGDFDWPPISDWPKSSERIRNDTLNLWNANESENKKEHPFPSGSNKIYAFKLFSKGPWIIIRHPLWRWGLDEGPLADFADKLDPDYRKKGTVLCWDTFNLSRRPGRTKQWMDLQRMAFRKQRRSSRIS